MVNTFYKWKLNTTFIIILILLTYSVFSQQKVKSNKYYGPVIKKQSLDTILPINDIQSIIVENYSGSYELTKYELNVLKNQLKKAKFAGGLLVKPGHITLLIKLQTKTKAKTGYVYAYKGMVNFDGGVNKSGKEFSGTYYLPLSINFDKYK